MSSSSYHNFYTILTVLAPNFSPSSAQVFDKNLFVCSFSLGLVKLPSKLSPKYILTIWTTDWVDRKRHSSHSLNDYRNRRRWRLIFSGKRGKVVSETFSSSHRPPSTSIFPSQHASSERAPWMLSLKLWWNCVSRTRRRKWKVIFKALCCWSEFTTFRHTKGEERIHFQMTEKLDVSCWRRI